MGEGSFFNKGVEGRGIYAGGLSFILSTLAGSLGGTIGLVTGWFTDYSHTPLERAMTAFSFGVGLGAVGAGTAAVFGLLCGSYLARSFNWIFMTALVWVAAMVAIAITAQQYPAIRGLSDPTGEIPVIVGCAANVVGACAGILIGANCDGFSRRARKRAAVGGVIGGVLAAGWLAVAFGLWGWTWEDRVTLACGLITLVSVGIFGMIGAITGADREGDRERGFVVMDQPLVVRPIDDPAAAVEANPAPPSPSSRGGTLWRSW